MKLLLIMLLPPAEVLLAMSLGREIGAAWVWAALALGVVAGSLMIRWRGQVFFRQAMEALNRQEMPSEALVGGIAWYVAGVLFIVPGFISDVLGLVVLLPPVRRRVLARFRKLAEERLVQMQGTAGFQWRADSGWTMTPEDMPDNGNGRVFEGEGWTVEEDAPRLPPADKPLS
ncbi:MAG: FxsA family protein [Moraxellaceae bacterium]|nr:FxsA family protein [Moraxellaceae bacterium]